ncbi:MAG: hypothetical protein RDU76_00160 [Candidatus Edwardsbacteria bacterium]|nr:hypothetical protein [Candidatus Edwardsbacteria bacterium]
MQERKLVARYLDGRIVKGHTLDFSMNKDAFHLFFNGGPASSSEVRIEQLKAVFFVKDFMGNREYDERRDFDGSYPVNCKKVEVTFFDGEKLTGVTEMYMPNRKGFFLFPADKKSNTEKVFVVNKAVQEVKFL